MGSRGIYVLAALLAGLFTACAAWAGASYPFDQSGYLGDAALMPDWSATMQRQQEQSQALEACMEDAAACRLVNRYVNRKRYRGDRTARIETALADEPVKYRSRWSTVEEFMRRGGDCEDYATTKYYLLRQLGFDVDQLRIVVTWERSARGYHAVLAVKHNDQVLLLESDNQIHKGRRHNYRFIYSVNEESIWDHESERTVSRRTHPKEGNPA
jgi:predicted transglutaminase-like cysteine proteinase